MPTDLWRLLRERDAAASANTLDLEHIATSLARSPSAEAESWLQSLEAAAAASKPASSPPPARGALDARMRLILSLRAQDNGRKLRANGMIGETLVEWGLRREFETWFGAPVAAEDAQWKKDAPKFIERLRLLGETIPGELKFTGERLAIWSQVLASSRSAQRRTQISDLGGLTTAAFPYENPCRPILADVTKYAQRDVVPRVPTDEWRNPVRIVDLRAGTSSTKPALLLIHGHGSCAEEYEELVDELRKHHATKDVRIVIPDLPGYGYSDVRNLGELTTAKYAGFLRQLMSQLGIQRYVPAGGSLGGNLTLQLVASEGETVVGGVSWSAVSWSPRYDAMVHFGRLARIGRELGPLIFWKVYNVQKTQWFPRWEKKKVIAALKASDVYRQEVATPEYQRADWDLIVDQCEQTHLDKVSKIKKPLLLMAGKYDGGPFEVHRSMRALHAKLAAQNGDDMCTFFDDFVYGDHSLSTEEPKLVAEKLASWYARWAM